MESEMVEMETPKETTAEELKALLQQPMSYMWRVQSAKYGKATCVAYVDSRDVQERLDKVFGPAGWMDKYYQVKNSLFCEISCRVGGIWVSKSDCGVESNMEAQKGESSDSFKRAAVKWGIGRFLYDLDPIQLPTKDYKGKEKPSYNGNILWTPREITDACNYIHKGGKPQQQPQQQVNKDKSWYINELIKMSQTVNLSPQWQQWFATAAQKSEEEIIAVYNQFKNGAK
jgi:hypothetical protein